MNGDFGDLGDEFQSDYGSHEDYDFYVNYSEAPSDPVDIHSPYYDPETKKVNIPAYLKKESGGEAPMSDIYNVLGKVIDVAGKTYTQIANQKYIQNYKKVPSVQTGMGKQVYLPLARARQTGLDTGISAIDSEQLVPGVSNLYLFIGAGLLIFIFVMK